MNAAREGEPGGPERVVDTAGEGLGRRQDDAAVTGGLEPVDQRGEELIRLPDDEPARP